MGTLSTLWHCITGSLLPALEEELDPLSEKQREFVAVCEVAQLDRHMGRYRWQGLGRKRKPRVDLAKAFVAKAVYNLPTTDALVQRLRDSKNLRRLCGWERVEDVPSEPTFSRAFAEFAAGDLGDVVHERSTAPKPNWNIPLSCAAFGTTTRKPINALSSSPTTSPCPL